MPKFSNASFKKLITCHTDLQALFFEVVKHVDCTILDGYRNQSAQNALFKVGASKLQYPKSKHNQKPSLAVDVAPYPIPEWKKIGDFVYFGGIVKGVALMLFEQGKMTHRIRYGGDWNHNLRVSDQRFGDFCHYELIA